MTNKYILLSSLNENNVYDTIAESCDNNDIMKIFEFLHAQYLMFDDMENEIFIGTLPQYYLRRYYFDIDNIEYCIAYDLIENWYLFRVDKME